MDKINTMNEKAREFFQSKWFIVFPFCGAIGYALTWLALRVF